MSKNPNWTGEACKIMHINNISVTDVAKKLDITLPYLSGILHGKRTPKHAEEKVFAAIDALIKER